MHILRKEEMELHITEVKKMLKELDVNPIMSMIAKTVYGSVEELKTLMKSEIEELKNEIAKESFIKPNNLETESKQPIAPVNIDFKEKPVRVTKGIFKGLEGIVVEDCVLLDKFLVDLGDSYNALYINKDDVEIVKEEKVKEEVKKTRGFIINGLDKELGAYNIHITQDDIRVTFKDSNLEAKEKWSYTLNAYNSCLKINTVIKAMEQGYDSLVEDLIIQKAKSKSKSYEMDKIVDQFFELEKTKQSLRNNIILDIGKESQLYNDIVKKVADNENK
ncbi:hypothetical protein [Clostridium tagluense]|uniref:Uncharacterized protein n=1 Tax=Clostridium tagluense TaxID=360422 RepID=A0A401UTK0_9CLOT|nr:hypothetical protein [Clostridium tagluense]GCD12880.1 hypothetical protein Ctaglu_45030 [Clostridium tagluense]